MVRNATEKLSEGYTRQEAHEIALAFRNLSDAYRRIDREQAAEMMRHYHWWENKANERKATPHASRDASSK